MVIKRSHYVCEIIPKSMNCFGFIPDLRKVTIEATNRFSAARHAWLYLGNYFSCSVIVRNIQGRVVYKTDFEAEPV